MWEMVRIQPSDLAIIGRSMFLPPSIANMQP